MYYLVVKNLDTGVIREVGHHDLLDTVLYYATNIEKLIPKVAIEIQEGGDTIYEATFSDGRCTYFNTNIKG